MLRNVIRWIASLIMTSCVASTVSFAQDSATPAQRARLLEERQIGRMALELEHRRNEVELLAGENEKYKSLVENLNKQIEEFNRLVAQYKKAADERGKALEAFGKIEALYKSTIADQDKRIRRLEATNSLLKKLAPAAAIAGFVLGILVGAK